MTGLYFLTLAKKLHESVADKAEESVKAVEHFTTRATEIGIEILVVLVCTWLIKRIVSHMMKKLERTLRAKGSESIALVSFIRHLLSLLIYVGGFLSVVGILSESIPVFASVMNKLLAAGGVLTVVAGLASQEALGSMVSGVMILAFRPFRLGDVVRYVDNNISGVVEEITVHHTTIRTWENKRVIVPNSKMNNAILENADYADKKVCVLLEVGISYESNIDLAKKLLSEQIQKHPSFFDYRTDADKAAGAPPVLVRVVELADSSIILRAWMWGKDNATASAMKSDILQGIKQTYDANGVDIAYPHLVVVSK